MKMKKWITTGLLTASLLALAACGESSNTSEENDGTKTVGVLQLVEHGSLNAAYEGFKEGLAEAGYTEGENLTIEYQNAQNSQDNLKSMSERLVNASPDLLLGIATPAAVSLANETTDTPIVVTAVTDLVGAKLADSNEEPGRNITGTSDMVPIEQQINLLLSILKAAGVDVKVLTANTTNDVQQVTTSLAKDVDGIYVPTDNTFASAAAIVGEVAKETKTPIVAGSVEQVDDGALATYGIDYKSLGIQTGKLAAKILDGDAEPATTPVETADNLELVVNEEMAAALGIDPASITAPE